MRRMDTPIEGVGSRRGVRQFREVMAMPNLVTVETEQTDFRFLELACGDGNFLIGRLRRKLAVCGDRFRMMPSGPSPAHLRISPVGGRFRVNVAAKSSKSGCATAALTATALLWPIPCQRGSEIAPIGLRQCDVASHYRARRPSPTTKVAITNRECQ